MFFDIEIDEELFDVPLTPPRLTRQNACSNLLELSNSVLSINTEVDFDEYIFKSMPNFGNSINNNLLQIRRYNSDLNQTTKSTNLKRINTF